VGILAAAATATIHALHPSPIPFTLLCVFFLLGTSATKVKHDIKATLTLSSSGSSGGEGPRTSIQVLANSGCASLLVLVHLWQYGLNHGTTRDANPEHRLAEMLLMGIMANYTAVAADTLSSELGILSKSKPVLITTLRTVPPGTNGGVTFAGLQAGVGGAAVIAATSVFLLHVSEHGISNPLASFLILTGLGTAGTLLDSLLGAMLQASVIDRRTGKIVEGAGGVKVLTKAGQSSSHVRTTSEDSRVISSGTDLLDNNQINLLMASIISLCGVLAGL
jgi:uncharacterized protein (TIGR00297 family)